MPDTAYTPLFWKKRLPILPSARPRIVLALSGGGVRGMAHIGLLKVLQEESIPICAITGCSAGAIVGGLYAATEDVAYTKNTFTALASITKNYKIVGIPKLLRGIQGNGFISLERGIKFLKQELGHNDFEKLQLPLGVGAVSLKSGRLTIFTSGELTESIAASAAIPGIFTPVSVDGSYYVDGNLICHMPAEAARMMGADIVVGVSIFAHHTGEDIHKNVVARSIAILDSALLARERAWADMVIEAGFTTEHSLLATNANLEEMYARGMQIAKERVAELHKLIMQWKPQG